MRVPGLVQQRAAGLGVAGEEWLAGLDRLVADLARQWSLTVGASLSGGSAAYVARARTAEGRDAVLKVALPDPDLDVTTQVRTLAAADGVGYVMLLAHDVERRALLLEALGSPLSQFDGPPERKLRLLGALLRRAWRVPRPDSATLEQAQDKATTLATMVRSLWNDLERPCPKHVVALALRYAERRRVETRLDTAALVHGDPHPDNALQVLKHRLGTESGFVLVDPDGFLADPAYDLGVVLREWCDELLIGDANTARADARRYCRLLAAETGLSETAIWEWGFLERVSSGLYLMQLGVDDLGRKYLRTAERLAAGQG